MRLIALAALLTLATAGPGASRESAIVLDRTYRCVVPPAYDDVRQINFGASNRRESPTPEGSDYPASVFVGARRGGSQGERSFLSLVSRPSLDQEKTGSIWVDPRACSHITKPTIPLVSRGLPGPPTLFELEVVCPVSSAVIVRVRAIVDRTPRFRKRSDSLVANVNVLEAKVAVHTLKQRPVAYVSIARSGATKTYYSSDCEN